MSHSRTCVFHIPLIAVTMLALLWLVITYARTQAHPVMDHRLSSPQVGADHWQHATAARENTQLHSPQQLQPSGPPYSITIQPATAEMLQTHFPDQVGQRGRSSGPAMLIAKTVGMTEECAPTDLQLIAGPTQVVYCYVIYNVGSTTLITQTVVDDQLGTLVENYYYTVAPNDGGIIQVPITVENTVKNIVTWQTTDENGLVLTATEDAFVVVPTLALTTTLSKDPSKCGEERTLSALPDTTISVCYTVKNTSPVTLTNHTLEDSSVGLVYRDPSPLAPGAERSFKRTLLVTETTTNIISWTATTEDAIVAKAVDQVTIQIPSIELHATVGVDTTECALTDAITVPIDSNVTLCYLVVNTGGYLLDKHVVSDTIFAYAPIMEPLPPGHSFGFKVPPLTVTESIFGVGEWRASGPGGLLAVARDSFTITIRSDAVIEVFVFYDVDGQGSFQRLEPGIANVEITLTSPRNRHYSVRTDDTGVARLDGVPEDGNYAATINMETVPSGYVQTTQQRDIAVVRGQTATQRIGFKAPVGTDNDADGIVDQEESAADPDADEIPNYLDSDSDNDGISDQEESAADFDADNIPNYLDLDSDDDGLTDKFEGNSDSNMDGRPNRLDPTRFSFLPIISGE